MCLGREGELDLGEILVDDVANLFKGNIEELLLRDSLCLRGTREVGKGLGLSTDPYLQLSRTPITPLNG